MYWWCDYSGRCSNGNCVSICEYDSMESCVCDEGNNHSLCSVSHLDQSHGLMSFENLIALVKSNCYFVDAMLTGSQKLSENFTSTLYNCCLIFGQMKMFHNGWKLNAVLYLILWQIQLSAETSDKISFDELWANIASSAVFTIIHWLAEYKQRTASGHFFIDQSVDLTHVW